MSFVHLTKTIDQLQDAKKQHHFPKKGPYDPEDDDDDLHNKSTYIES